MMMLLDDEVGVDELLGRFRRHIGSLLLRLSMTLFVDSF
jgi:hypothetical protein